MKSSEEMTNSIFKRREEYFAERKKKRRRAASVAAVTAVFVCAAALAGLGVWRLGTAGPKAAVGYDTSEPEGSAAGYADTEDTVSADTEKTGVETAEGDAREAGGGTGGSAARDVAGTLRIGEEWFVQAPGQPADEWTEKDFLGNASEFDGAYKALYNQDGIDGAVYSVNESPDVVLIFLTNGGKVVLEKFEGDMRMALPEGGAAVTGAPITDAEAEEFFDENLVALSDMLSLHGSFGDIGVGGKGFCPIVRDASGEDWNIDLNERDYYLLDGDSPIAEYKLTRDEDGILHGALKRLFGHGETSDFLKEKFQKHKGEELILIDCYFCYYFITPENGFFSFDMSSRGHYYGESRADEVFSVEENFDVYGYLYNENSVYIP